VILAIDVLATGPRHNHGPGALSTRPGAAPAARQELPGRCRRGAVHRGGWRAAGPAGTGPAGAPTQANPRPGSGAPWRPARPTSARSVR